MMDADGTGFSFSATDFSRGQQDATDPMSWGDIFLDSIVADDSNDGGINDGVLGPSAPLQVLQQSSQSSALGQQLQIQLAQQNVSQHIISDTGGTNIPTHLQATLTNNGVPQCNTSNIGGSVAYLTPSASSQQHITSGGNIQNVLANHQSAAVTVSQGGTKLVQIGPSFATLPNSVPLQTLLQPGQQLAGQTLYGGQNQGMFPAQGSVHIENPKVVNVNFGPHVIQPDSGGQQTIIQTAEGKRVLITNQQLQQLQQSLSLTQPIVGTQLINPAGNSMNNVIRTTVAQAAPNLVNSSTANTRQILLPSGQTVIPRQNGNPQAGFSKNVLLRPLNPGVQPVIYQSGQGSVAGQLIQSQPALITSSGGGLQVVNTGGSQGNQVQLIAQPSINQSAMGQQQLSHSALMNLIGNQGVLPNTGNQMQGLMQGQNILVNGQMLNLSQVGGLTLPLQVQGTNTQGAVTVAGINSGNRQFGAANQQMIIQQSNGQQQIMIQPKNTLSPSLIHPNSGGNQWTTSFQPKISRTPTPSANSASSTPVPTPTPSTPTPTPTPDLNLSDFGNSGSKSSQNILEEALKLSSIDLQSYEDDEFNFFNEPVCDSITSQTPPPAPIMTYPKTKPQPAPKAKAKISKPKAKLTQPIVNVTVNNNFQSTQSMTTQAQKVNITPQQKIITASGQVYVISANGQQLVLQQTPPTSKPIVAPGAKVSVAAQPSVSIPSTFVTTSSSRSSINIPVGNHRAVKSSGEQMSLKLEPVSTVSQVKVDSKPLISSTQGTHQLFLKGGVGSLKAQPITSTTEFLPQISSSVSGNQKHVVQIKNQQISTLAGKIIKPEPVVKQEVQADVKTIFSLIDSQSEQSSSVLPTTSVVSVNVPHVVASSPSNTLSTNITLSQPNTVMSTSSAQPILVNQSHSNMTPAVSHTTLVKTMPPVQDVIPSQSPPLTPTSHSSSAKNLKGKDSSANFKSLTQIKIANTTLKLTLTAHEKERLENQISYMSLEKQEQLLNQQQKIILRSQDLQKKQQEQQRYHQQRILLQKHKEHQQQSVSTTKPASVSLPSPANTNSHNHIMDGCKLASGGQVNEASISCLPSTVQEMIEKNEKSHLMNGSDKSVQQQQSQIPQQTEKPVYSSQSQASILHNARCLRAEQQLHRDCTLAIAPDIHSSFKNLSDAMRRLVRYHTMQEHKPHEGSESMAEWDGKYNKVCERLMKKKRCFMRRFTKLMVYKDMCPEQWSDNIQNLKSFNESLKEHLVKERAEALNHPDTFQPLQPELLAASSNQRSEDEEVSEDSDQSVEEYKKESPQRNTSFHIEHGHNRRADLMIKREIKREPPELPPTPAIYSVSSLKRKHEEKQSSGTLKLVLKRRTTDNFVVKSSSHDKERVSGGLKPVVDMEICDSLYEFDSKGRVNKDNSVLVRRRESLISQASRHSISEQEVASYSSSQSSNREEDESDNDVETEEEEEGHSSSENEESADEEMEEENMQIDNLQEETQQSRSRSYYPSFNEEIKSEHSNLVQLESEEKKMDLDAFAESSQWTAHHDVPNITRKNIRIKYSDVSACDPVSRSGSSGTSKRSFSPSDLGFLHHRMSVASDDVFTPAPGFPHSEDDSGVHSRKNSVPNFQDIIGKGDDTYIPTSSIQSSIQSSRSATPLHELVATSPASHLETAAASGQLLPSTALFTTPNKNLLQTDYVMFNSSEDEDDDKGSATSFKIDNRDPQSSMINDSVRTAINSVINNDDDDDLNQGAQAQWAPAAHRRSSFFNPPLSSSVSPTHD